MSLKSESFKKLRKLKNKWKVESWEDYDKRESKLYSELFQNREPTILGKLKISAGEKKNFMLEIPKSTRPLTTRLKLTVFDVLSTDILKKRILDLFAGSGSFGFEALSRGAASCTFVDAAKAAERILLTNSKMTGYLTETNIVRMKADEYLKETIKDDETEFDIIFIDPPYKLYNTKDRSKIFEVFDKAKELLPGIRTPKTKKFKGALIVKHPRRYNMDLLKLEKLEKIQTYEFGLNAISLYIVASGKSATKEVEAK